jgi:tRNA-specific adenosine deaminase 2
MCASLLRQFGISKVFFGASNEKFGGTGGVLDIHSGNGRRIKEGEARQRVEGDYEVSGGWLREEAIILLRRFYVQENERGELFLFPLTYFLDCTDVLIAPEPRNRTGERVLKLEVEPLVEDSKSETGGKD